MAVLQNWSMQVKYASRHVLYPVPNVIESYVFNVIVPRAAVADLAARPNAALIFSERFVLPVRVVGVDVAERAAVVVFVARAVVAERAEVFVLFVVGVAVRAMVLREAAVREIVVRFSVAD